MVFKRLSCSKILLDARKWINITHRGRNKQTKCQLRCKQEATHRLWSFKILPNHLVNKTDEQWNDQFEQQMENIKEKDTETKTSKKSITYRISPWIIQWSLHFLFLLPKHLAKLTDVPLKTHMSWFLSKQLLFLRALNYTKKEKKRSLLWFGKYWEF